MQNELEQLGFSNHEAKVYIALLDVGATTVGEIIKKCGLHRNIVYECLDKLRTRKLVTETQRNGKKFFTPLDPNSILGEANQKLAIAEKIVPELLSKIKNIKQQIIIHEGEDEYREFQLSKIKAMHYSETYYVIGATQQWFTSMGKNFFEKYERERIERKISAKILFYSDQFNKNKPIMQTRTLIDWRVINANLDTPAYTIIWPDSINIAIFSTPLINIEIKNPDVMKAYLNYFNLLWKMGEKNKL